MERDSKCTCGSGGHPRKCNIHIGTYELHVADLNLSNSIWSAESTDKDLPEQIKYIQECYDKYDAAFMTRMRNRAREEYALRQQRDRLLERVQKLESALRPFALLAKSFEDKPNTHIVCEQGHRKITVNTLTYAAEVLEEDIKNT